MSFFLKQMMIQRLKTVSLEELIVYSERYGFYLNRSQAEEIILYLRHLSLDPFQRQEREQIFADLAQLTDPETAHRARSLFKQLIHDYGLAYLFD